MSRQIYSLSKQRPLLLALGFDHHKLAPQLEEAEGFVLDLPVPDFVAEVRDSVRLLSDLPSDALDALDRYDPDHTAIVIVPTFSELPEIAGRRVYGARLEAWRELEDKTLADSLWDECGVRRAPSQVVSTNPDDLLAAARRLDRGAGTVWAGDAREGPALR